MKNEERRNYGKATALIFMVLIATLAFISVGCASAATIFVPDDYAKIQWTVDNATAGDTIIVRDGTYTENVDVNKRLTIQSENGSDKTIVQTANPNDPVFEVTADYVNISGFTVKGATEIRKAGIYLNAKYCNIMNNTALNNDCGIYLDDSSNNNISNNNLRSNKYFGIWLLGSSNNILTNNIFVDDGLFVGSASRQNTVQNNIVNGKPLVYLEDVSDAVITDAGQIILVYCGNIRVEGLNIYNTTVGIELFRTDNCNIANNNLSNNYYGIYLKGSSNTITNNNASNNNLGIWLGAYSNNNVLVNNIANSNNDYGICLEYSCNNNILANNNASNNNYGIWIESSNNNLLIDNTANSNNYHGICLGYSGNNTLTNNTMSNNGYGIYVGSSSNNRIYLNNFINNSNNVYSYDSTNIWNSSEEMTYTYNGTTFINYLGNYWDDYTGNDADEDGIGDTPYSIDSDADNYPLMEPWENYFAPKVNVFDTGSPANPYPSIMGTHTGTIKPYHTVIATKLYTYPCAGTGGHTEYARIWNSTLDVNATWNGYVGDWHNITFDKTVVLLANETYNYTIRTGSYPQIHHTPALPTANGWINCTKFTDVNGKIYYDWIPAIKLWAE